MKPVTFEECLKKFLDGCQTAPDGRKIIWHGRIFMSACEDPQDLLGIPALPQVIGAAVDIDPPGGVQ